MTFQQVRQYVKGIISALDIKKIVSDEISDTLYDNTKTGFTPVGTIITVMGNEAPRHYLKCEGQIVNIADYKELADYFENEFGTKNHFGGDGTTTFGVPDLRGEFLRGTGINAHANQGNGAGVGVHQNATKITQALVSKEGNTYFIGGQNTYSSEGDSNPLTPYNNKRDADTFVKSSDNVWVGTTSHNTTTNLSYLTARPTNTSVLYCIATKNIYIDARYDYSTEEKVVGTWIDGKPIYQKTIVTTAGPDSSGKALYDVTGLNIIGVSQFRLEWQAGSERGYVWDTRTSRDVDFYTSDNTLYNKVCDPPFYGGELIATLQYTKTTD